MITEERFVKNINLMLLSVFCGNDETTKKIFEGILAHFPNKKDELEHYCFKLDFGKCGEDYEEPKDFYKRLTIT